MKKIKGYWFNLEFDPEAMAYRGYMRPVKHSVEFEVPDNATEEEINNIARRRDIIVESYR